MRRLPPAILLLILLAPAVLGTAATKTYSVGEPITIDTGLAGRMVIDAPEARYRTLGTPSGPFIPKTPGNYTVTLYSEDGTVLFQDSFTVSGQRAAYAVSIDQASPAVGQNVTIRIAPQPEQDVEVTISAPGGEFRYAGPWTDSPFVPQAPGRHEIKVRQHGTVIAATTFDVGRTGGAAALRIRSSKGLHEAQARFTERTERGEARYDAELGPHGKAARRVLIRGLRNSDVQIGLEDVPPESVALQRGPALKAYAVDMGTLEFDSAQLTSVAEGSELWKCALWNFTEQTCEGTWTKLMDIVPGQEYHITLLPGDPGYAETGVATVNSVKPVHLPGETAELLMVVLDTGGFLVDGADVTLTITAPTGEETVIDAGIEQVARGVYRATYQAGGPGNYTVLVRAAAEGVDSTMMSSFAVMEEYDFDILRETPVTTDPFKGPFDSRITVTPRIGVEAYDLTEIIPGEFSLLDAPGASVTRDSANTYLTWQNLSGSSTVQYTARPPLATPALFALGQAFVTYIKEGAVTVFRELRAWFLAIDPEVARDQGLLVYGDRTPDGSVKHRNWTGSISAEDDSGLALGSRTSWFRFRCLKHRPECLLLASDSGNDLEFAVFDSSSWRWRNATQLDSNLGQDDQLQFDMECEDVSGDCLIAYEDSTGSDGTFHLLIWNASGLQTTATISIPGAESNNFHWLELYPHRGTDRIGIALQNDGGGGTGDTPAIYAGIWDGSAFSDWSLLTSAAPAQGNGRTFFRHFDCAWEGGGSFLCFYGENNLNGIRAHRWSGSWAGLGTVYGATGDEVLEIAACGQEPWSDFSHGDIGLFFCDDGGDLDGGLWNGTALSKAGPADAPAANTNAECGSNKAATEWARPFECRWERSGDQAVFVWVAASNQDWLTSGTYTRSTGSWSMADWSSGSQVSADSAGNLRMVQMVPNQASDEIFMVYADGSSDGGCSYWSGNGWDSTNCNGGAAFETSGAQAARQWIIFDWFRVSPPQPEIAIVTPSSTTSTYTYAGILAPSATHRAFGGSSAELPPSPASAPVTGTEFPNAGYVNVSGSDDARHSSVVTGSPSGRRAYQSFIFAIADSVVDITSLTITHEGFATESVTQAADQFSIYIYNWTSDSYVLKRTNFPSTVDVISEITLEDGFSDLIRNRQLIILVEGDFAIGTGGSSRADVRTDYIGVVVNERPALRASATVSATAADDDGISACQWELRPGTGGPMAESGGAYSAAADTTGVPDGVYNLTVRCADAHSNSRNTSIAVRIDNTPPVVELLHPPNASGFTTPSVMFSWNATDIPSENMVCTLSVGQSAAASGVVSPHGENTSATVGSIADGSMQWSVACTDEAGNAGASQSRLLDIDTAEPGIALLSPGNHANASTVNFTYIATDAHALPGCSLTLDGVLNASVAPASAGSVSNFTIAGLQEGRHEWSVSCTDTFGFQGSAAQNVTVDYRRPVIMLNVPNGTSFADGVAHFNFTAWDTVDVNLTCDITANGAVVASGIITANGTPLHRAIDLPDGAKVWSVACTDDAGNSNASAQGSFTIIGGPYVQQHLPRNNTFGNGSVANFTYYVEDGNGIAGCSLFIDGTLNRTNSTPVAESANNTFPGVQLAEGVHGWHVSCTDNTATPGAGAELAIISDRSPPLITPLGPSGQVLTTTPVLFNFTVEDAYSPNMTCSLAVDGEASGANQGFIALNGSRSDRSQVVINGAHVWSVTCADLGGNSNTSPPLGFAVNVTFPLDVTVEASKSAYQEGETALIETTVRNESGSEVQANLTLDIIYTNASAGTGVPWWDTSWGRRKPILINASGAGRQGKPVEVNITGLAGRISGCGELRVAADDDLSERALNVLGGDDVTFCHIQFNATVSAGAVEESRYHVYYGNPGATHPGHPSLTSWQVIFSDDFSDGGTGGWTASGGWDRATNTPMPGGHAHIDGPATDATMRPAQLFDLSGYDEANLTLTWEIESDWDAGEYIELEFTNDSESSWTRALALEGDVVEGVTVPSTVSFSAGYMVSGFNARFRSTVSATTEEGGFDDFTLAARNTAAGASARAGDEQTLVERTAAAGSHTGGFATTGRHEGNYSAVARAMPASPANRPGTGHDSFRIVPDDFGPEVTPLHPSNGSTNRTGTILFLYTAQDVAGSITGCRLIIDGSTNQTNATPVTSGTNTFALDGAGEGTYAWSISCTDDGGNSGSSQTAILHVDDTAPEVTAISPDGTTEPSGAVTFLFSVSDNIDTAVECTVEVDSSLRSSVNATGPNASVLIAGIPDGPHQWNVTCSDNAHNAAGSDTLGFTVNTAPAPLHHSPADGYGVNSTGIILHYNLTESDLESCSLYLNGALSMSNATPVLYTANDGSNNFTLEGLPYGIYNWSVACTDTGGSTGRTGNRTFQLDGQPPVITLHFPGGGDELFSRTVAFNFTADDIGPALQCSVNVNGAVNATATVTAGVSATASGTGFSAGAYLWNVTCTDSAGLSATSETREFTVEARVRVALTGPADGSSDGDGVVQFTYIPQSIGGFELGFCDLFLDGIVNDTHVSPVADMQAAFTVPGVPEGTHAWRIECTDSGLQTNTSELRQFIVDTQDPSVLALSPDGVIIPSSSVVFIWEARDNLDTALSCSVLVNGTEQQPGGIPSPNATLATSTYGGFTDGFHAWNITCADDAARTGTSQTLGFTIAEPPQVVLEAPVAGHRTANQTLGFTWTPADNSGSISSCTVIIDGVANTTNQTALASGSSAGVSIGPFAPGTHTWEVSCTDRSANQGASSQRSLIIDLEAPQIALVAPSEGEALNTNNVSFSWTAEDFNASVIAQCSLSVTNGTGTLTANASGTGALSAHIADLGDGPHQWNVTCADDLGNSATSATRSFTINQPDILLQASGILFSNANPAVGETLTISANASNVGGVGAVGVNVTFWAGPGVYIGSAVHDMPSNASVLFSVPWTVTAGHHTIFVSADPQGAIGELDEENNNATAAISAIFVAVTSPPNDTHTGDATPQITFNATDFTQGMLAYSIFIDGTHNGQAGGISQGLHSLNLSAAGDGARSIIVQVTDGLGRSRNSTPHQLRIDTAAPSVSFITPNGTWFGTQSPTVLLSLTDMFSATVAYSAFLDGSLHSAGNATAGGMNLTLSALAQGPHTLVVQTTDDVSNTGNSTELAFFVDITPPDPSISTANGTWFSTGAPEIAFTIADNLAGALNWTLFIDGNANATGTAANGSPGTGQLSAAPEGNRSIVLQAVDEAGNARNSTPAIIRVDVTPPAVTLVSPLNDTNLTTDQAALEFAASDSLADSISCELTLDGNPVAQYNGSGTYGATGLAGGYHAWNVTCTDNAGNAAASETWLFFIRLPDFIITAGNITISNSTPQENQTVRVSAAVRNIGDINISGNITAQLWLGDPAYGGTQIGADHAIAGLAAGQEATILQDHNALIGLNEIFILIDPANAYAEKNETNNKASAAFWVGLYEVFAGAGASELRIADSSIVSAFTWDQADASGSNIFVADAESGITFARLHALGTDLANGTDTGGNDFAELDGRIGAAALNDSINNTWTSGGHPRDRVNITAFGRQVANVPVINSTNTTAFRTGILWDAGDENPGHYNGSQDVVFVTVMNRSQPGMYGVYDYEIRVPATLRSYVPGGATVAFYTELK